MAHDYTPKHFLRQAPNELLKAYFARKGELADVKWDELEDEGKDVIHDVWYALPADRIGQVESEFRAIYELATEDGVRTIFEEANIFAPETVPEIQKRDGFVHKAFWVFLNKPTLFAHVSRCDHADHLKSRCWKTRKGLPKKHPDVSDAAVSRLAKEVGEFYWDREGRGGANCKGESFKRGDQRAYVFVYPQNYTDTFIGYKQDGTFVRAPQQPAFEIVFAFDPSSGVLDLYAKGEKRVKEKLEAMFARCILGENIGAEPPNSDVYELDGLKHRGFPMPTDLQDNIKDVRVKTLRLYLPDHEGQILIDTAAGTDAPDELYRIMEDYLVAQKVTAKSVRVGGATIQMALKGQDGQEDKEFDFNISAKSSRNLNRDRPEDRLARKYLKKWRIVNA